MKKHLLLLLQVIYLQILFYLLCNFWLYWSRSLSSQGIDASARRCSNGSIKLEVDTVCWLLWSPPAKETTGKERGYCIAGMTCDYQGEIGLLQDYGSRKNYV